MRTWKSIAVIAVALLEMATADAATPLAAARWRYRPLLVFAAGEDARLERQRAILSVAGAGCRDRDLRVVTIVGDAVSGAADRAAALRHRYHVDPAAFAVILIGKDGGEKLRSADPLAADALFATIDAMPMRREERRR